MTDRTNPPGSGGSPPRDAKQPGERRVVTALFCDVVGSTAIAEQLDPEDWADLMNEAMGLLGEPVQRYEGIVTRFMGDGLLALFGAPVAHEDDAQRAVLAGLAMHEAIRPFQERFRREHDSDFGIRVGINTGPVMVGRVGFGTATDYTTMGDAVNVAARMEQTASPGTVQISAATHQIVDAFFDTESLGVLEIKGKSGGVGAFRVIAVKADPERHRGLPGIEAALVGRETELSTLTALADELLAGRGNIVCLIGEAGLGKSRLIEELNGYWESVAADRGAMLVARSAAYDSSRPYGMARQLLSTMLDQRERPFDSDGDKSESTDAGGDLPPALRAVLGKSSVPTEEESGEKFKRDIHDGAAALSRSLTERGPAIVVLDDLHWADPASVELVVGLFELVDELPLLFLCAFRPDRQAPGWQTKVAAESGFPHRYTELVLRPLSGEDSVELVDRLLAVGELPVPMTRLIQQKAEGNPLFVEEVVRTLIDSGAIERDETGSHWRATETAVQMEIPDNLRALLTARIDMLDEEVRHTLQAASVIGRSFEYEVLKRVATEEADLDGQLRILQRVELIAETRRLPDIEYTFRHELTRDAVYDTMLRRQRAEYHRRAGEAIESTSNGDSADHADRLGHHFLAAGDDAKALNYLKSAGDSAARLYAAAEAATLYGQALEVARRGDEHQDQLEHLFSVVGQQLELSGRHDEALENYRAMEQWGRESSEPPIVLAALMRQATVYSTLTEQLDPDRAEAISEQTLVLARELGDYEAEATTLWNLMLLNLYGKDNPIEAVAFGEQAAVVAREHNLEERLAFVLNDLGRAYVYTGPADRSVAALLEARELWTRLDNQQMLADNYAAESAARGARGELAEAEAAAAEGLNIARRSNNAWGQANTQFDKSAILLEMGDIGAALDLLEQTVSLADEGDFAFARIPVAVLRTASYLELGAIGYAFEATKLVADIEGSPLLQIADALFSGPPHLLARIHLAQGDFARAADVLVAHYGAEIATPSPGAIDLFRLQHVLAVMELDIGQGRPEKACELGDYWLKWAKAQSFHGHIPDLSLRQARGLLAMGKSAEAHAAFDEARKVAAGNGARRVLWHAAAELAQLEQGGGDTNAAAVLWREARTAVDFIADHAGSPEFKASFLGRPSQRSSPRPADSPALNHAWRTACGRSARAANWSSKTIMRR